MPMFAARWPDFTLSLVEARNERELFEKLDELSEATAVNYKKLQTPLFITLNVNSKEELECDADPDAFDLSKSLLNDDSFYDITLTLKAGVSIKAHKAVLASRCPFFKQLFEGSPDTNSFALEDVHIDVFKVVKHFLYTNKLEVDKDLPFKTLLDILRYSYQVMHLPKLTELIAKKIRNKVSCYSLQVSMAQLCSAYRATENIEGIGELKETIKKHLLDSMRKDVEAEIKSEDENLYHELVVEVNRQEEKQKIQNSFQDLLSKGKGKNLVTDVQHFLEKNHHQDLISESINPFRIICLRYLEKSSTASFKKQCLGLFQILTEHNFNINMSGKRYVYHSALHATALSGCLDLVKTLVKAGASPLLSVDEAGSTLLHELHEKLTEAKCPNSALIARLAFDGFNLRQDSIKDIEKVFQWLMSHKGFRSITEVPHNKEEKEVKIGSKYVEDLTGDGLHVPFVLDEIEGDTECEFRNELDKFFHPCVSEIASSDLESWQKTKAMKQKITDAIRQDMREATWVLHRDPKSRKMVDADDADSDDDIDMSDLSDNDGMW